MFDAEQRFQLAVLAKTVKTVQDLFEIRYGALNYKKEAFSYIATDPARFLLDLYEVRKILLDKGIDKPKFLECGCGFPLLSKMAQIAGCSVQAIEYNKHLIKEYESFKDESLSIKHADLEFYTDYAEFDIIQFYRPMEPGDGQKKFETLLAKNAKQGAIVMAYLPLSVNSIFGNKSKIFERISENLYIKR